MTLATAQHTNNVVVGAGEVFIDRLDSAGGLTGERYVGDSVGASIGVASELTTVFSGDGAAAAKLEEFARAVERTISLTLHDISPENLALFVGADEPGDSAAQGAAAVTDEAIAVMPGRWYQLGQTADKPRGVGGIAAAGLVVTNAGGATTYTAETDYTADHARGRLYIAPGGAIGSETVKVDYTPLAAAAGARRVVKTGAARQFLAAVRYIETPAAGKGRDIYARRCSITAGGEMALKSRDAEQQLTLTCAVLEPAAGAALHIDGEPA